MGPIFVNKSIKEGPILRKLQTFFKKAAVCEVKKPLEMGPDFH